MKNIFTNNIKFTVQLLLLCTIFLISACDKNKTVFNNAIQNNAKATSPTQVSISDFNKQVNLSWIPIKGAKSYKIFISDIPNTDISTRTAEIEIDAEKVSISQETFPGFKQNKQYFITIVTISENEEEFASSEFEVISKAVEVVEALTPPENFTVEAEEGQLIINWDINDSAINYVIYWSSTDPNVNPVNAHQITDIATPPFKHKNLSSETTYHYRVGAITSQGASPLSTPLSLSPNTISYIPNTPTGLTAVASDGIVALRWDPEINADSYTLYMAEESGISKTNVAQLQGGQSYTGIKGISTNRIQLINGTNYYFSISAENHIGSSESTEQVAATPKSNRPQVPNNTSASAGARRISLQWDEVPDSTSYSVYWSTEPGVDITSTNAFHEVTKANLVHENIDQTVTHYYVITARNNDTESETSAEVAATPFIPPLAPPAPTNILSEVSARTATLNWNEVPDIDEYILYIASDDGLSKTNYALLPNGTRHRNLQQTSFVRKELTPSTTYYYAISTVKNGIESKLSPLQTFITLNVSDKPNEGGETPEPVNILAPDTLNRATLTSYQLQAISGDNDVTSQVTWSSSDPTIATVSSQPDSAGVLTLLSSGNVTITAQFETIESNKTIVIIDESIDTTAPSIINVLPTSNAESVPINSTMSVTFSETMDANTLHPENMSLITQDNNVEFDVAFTGTKLSISPKILLAYDANYVFSINNEITDLAGNVLAEPLSINFKTELEPVLTIAAPEAINKAQNPTFQLNLSSNGNNVTSQASWHSNNEDIAKINERGQLTPVAQGEVVISANYEGNASVTSIYVYDLSSPINVQAKRNNGMVELVWEGSGFFSIYRSTTLPVTLENELIATTDGRTFIDETPAESITYYAIARTQVKDEQVYTSEISEPAMVDLADAIAPTVESVEPLTNAETVPINTIIKVNFSEAMNPNSFNLENVSLQQQDSLVDIDILLRDSQLTISPKNKLRYQSNYSLTISNQVTDIEGNPLTTPVSIDFQTELAPPLIINSPKSINKAEQSTFPLTVFFDGKDVTEKAIWQSNNQAIATVSNEAGTVGQLTLISKGEVEISATFESIKATANIYIYDLPTPINVQAKRIKGTVELSWEGGSNNFEIYRSDSLPVTINNTSFPLTSETSFIDNSPSNGISYYAILSRETEQEVVYRSPLSEAAQVDVKPIILPPPSNIKTHPQDNQINLSWDAVPNAERYIVRWSRNSGNVANSDNILRHESTLSADHFDLKNGDVFYYTISTINAEGIEGESSPEFEIEVGILLSDLFFIDSNFSECVINSGQQYVHRLPSLNCDNRSAISDLNGIEQLTSLSSFSGTLTAETDLGPFESIANKLTTLNFRDGALNPDLSAISKLNNLLWLLTQNILLDSKQLTVISQNTSIQYLMLANSGITDITPIMNMTSLLTLSIDDTFDSTTAKLSALPTANTWSKLINLTSLSLSYNDVSDISGITASGLPNLEELNIAHQGYPDTVLTSLPSIEEWNLPTLTTIEFIGNGITDLTPVSQLNQLNRINFNTNALNRGVYSLKNLSGAINIDLGNNPNMYCTEIETLDALSTANIIWDECKANMPIDSLINQGSEIISDRALMECIYFNDVANVEDVTNLDCYGGEGGNISSFEGIEILRQLNRLYLDYPAIEDVSNLKYIPNLKEISISYTDNLDLFTLSEVSQIEKLTLENMFLSNIEFLTDLTNLIELNLRHNNISDFSPLEKLTNLITLSIGYNDINNDGLESLTGLSKLHNLDLSNNIFTDISPLSKLTSLLRLDLGFNDIIDISPLTGLTDINILYLNNNSIDQFPSIDKFTGWENLIELDLSENHLFTRKGVKTNLLDTLQKIAGLKTLNISHNHLEWIGGLDRLTQLESLYLNNNNFRDISAIEAGSENNPNLNTLDLSNNLIHDPSPLEKFTQLSHLFLTNNILYQNLLTLITLQDTQIHADENPHMSCGEVKEIEASFRGSGSFNWTTCYDADGTGLSPQLIDILRDQLITDSTLSICIRDLMSQEPFGASQIHEVQDLSCNTEGSVQNLSGLRRLAALRTIDLPFHFVNDISELQYLEGLVDIDLSSNDVRSGASTLQNLPHLNRINLSDNTRISCRDINSLDSIDNNDGNATGKVIWTYCDNPIVDQGNLFSVESTVWCPGGGSYFQSFVPNSNQLIGVDLNIRSVNWQDGSNFNSIVNIRENLEGVPGEVLITGKWSVFENIPFSGKQISHVFKSILDVTPQQAYFIEWISPNPIPVPDTSRLQSLSVGLTKADSYKPGQLFAKCGDVISPPMDGDMIFQTLSNISLNFSRTF